MILFNAIIGVLLACLAMVLIFDGVYGIATIYLALAALNVTMAALAL